MCSELNNKDSKMTSTDIVVIPVIINFKYIQANYTFKLVVLLLTLNLHLQVQFLLTLKRKLVNDFREVIIKRLIKQSLHFRKVASPQIVTLIKKVSVADNFSVERLWIIVSTISYCTFLFKVISSGIILIWLILCWNVYEVSSRTPQWVQMRLFWCFTLNFKFI